MKLLRLILLPLFVIGCSAQVYSPNVLKAGQPDPTNLKNFAAAIYAQASANTPREKAEAIWRFFLTDGRFVKPGFWYHIAGWAYEEPMGEVLDPIKLLNSYGFGLCYQIAPVLEAVYDAGGFAHSRVWFLTGHTVAEVFYEGQYHYFDSDMMGYNPIGSGPLKQRPVASVQQIEQNGNIILGKMKAPRDVDAKAVDYPWYPADVRAAAINDLAELFTTADNNWLFAFQRYPEGHQMNFALRPGERMIRYFEPESPDLFYLPYKFNGTAWQEFPREFSEFKIRTVDGPRSQKDGRLWATGRIEYRPPLPKEQSTNATTLEVNMPCSYVIIDAQFAMNVNLASSSNAVRVQTSIDDGQTWVDGSKLNGPFHGQWTAKPAVIVQSAHGSKNAVSGSYGYRVRIHLTGRQSKQQAAVSGLLLTTRFQLNPRTLPALLPGVNAMEYHSAKQERVEQNVSADCFEKFALQVNNAVFVGQEGQGYIVNKNSQSGEITFALKSNDHELSGFEAGGRFLDLRQGWAPNKLTAETRAVEPWPFKAAPAPTASISWSLAPNGLYHELWRYDPKLEWKDGVPIDRTLNWPEVDRRVEGLPPGTHVVYLRYQLQGMAIDNFRFAQMRSVSESGSLRVTHIYNQDGTEQHSVRVLKQDGNYEIRIPTGTTVVNKAVVFESLPETPSN